jgi:hypothetical protein
MSCTHTTDCFCNDIVEIIEVSPGLVEITDQTIYVPPSPEITNIGSEGPQGIQGVQGLTGAQGIQGLSGAERPIAYTHDQGVSASTWTIVHNLNFNPNITIIDSAGSVVEGEIEYLDTNSIRLTFSYAFSGNAYLS